MYNNLKVPENNHLKENIEELLEWLEKKAEDEELWRTYFKEGISEKEMTDWEEAHGVQIPESYKEWLRFSKECEIDGTTAFLFGPDKFHSEYVPEDLIVIGSIIGDGERVCFSKETGEIVSYFEGEIRREYSDFNDVVKSITRLAGKPEKYDKEKKLRELRRFKAFCEKKLNGSDTDEKWMKELTGVSAAITEVENS